MADKNADLAAENIGLVPLDGLAGQYFGMVSSYVDATPIACTLKVQKSKRRTTHYFHRLTLNAGAFHREGYGLLDDLERDLATLLILYEADALRRQS